MNITSERFGRRHLHIPKLYAEVTSVDIKKKTNKRLTLSLKKKHQNPWSALISKTNSGNTQSDDGEIDDDE